jgi:hypothetical protein
MSAALLMFTLPNKPDVERPSTPENLCSGDWLEGWPIEPGGFDLLDMGCGVRFTQTLTNTHPAFASYTSVEVTTTATAQRARMLTQAAVTPERPAFPKLPTDSGHPSMPGVGSEPELRKGDSMSKR